jgi:hypothetical protein
MTVAGNVVRLAAKRPVALREAVLAAAVLVLALFGPVAAVAAARHAVVTADSRAVVLAEAPAEAASPIQGGISGMPDPVAIILAAAW